MPAEVQFAEVIGTKVKQIRNMTQEEFDKLFDWHHGELPKIIELENGVLAIPCRDPELNGPGSFENLERIKVGSEITRANSYKAMIATGAVGAVAWCDPEGNGPGHILFQDGDTYFDVR